MQIQVKGQDYRLRRLTDQEFDEATKLARMANVPLDVCPTCDGRDEEIAGSGGVKAFRSGTYRFRGEEFFCECSTQMALRSRYLLSHIGDQYMRLDWDDYDGPEPVRKWVTSYIDKWQDYKINGIGLEFGAEALGVGKTFAATTIGKELIKRNERVFFIPFLDMIVAYHQDNANELEERMRGVTFLILDEIKPPISGAQQAFFAAKFEALIRHRTNYNLPTIITTNILPDKLDELYPSTYSLLAAKQVRVDMSGDDARRGKIQMENAELVLNGERRPIT